MDPIWGLSRWVIGVKVRIIRFHEPPPCSRLVFLHLLFCMAVHLLVGLDVARDAQQFDVADIVCQPLHRLLSLGRLYWYLMVAVNSGGDVAAGQNSGGYTLSSASLAQASSPLPHLSLYLGPSWRVQQSLVSFVSAHSLLPFLIKRFPR